jgi:hypothetical protein
MPLWLLVCRIAQILHRRLSVVRVRLARFGTGHPEGGALLTGYTDCCPALTRSKQWRRVTGLGQPLIWAGTALFHE